MAVSVGGWCGIAKDVGSVVVERVGVDASCESCVFDEAIGVDLAVVEGVEQLSTEVDLEALRDFEGALYVRVPLLESFSVEGIPADGRVGVLVEPRNDPVHRIPRDGMAIIAGVPEAGAGADAAVGDSGEPGVVDGVGVERSLRVAEQWAIVADAVTVHVKSIFDVERRAGLELSDAGEGPVVGDVAEDLHAAFGMPDRRREDVAQNEAMTVIVG